jgi:hypothetical protein
LVPGDDFVQQVRDYRAGKSPFLRGTFHMIGLASEVIGADPRTKGVVVLQMTWSAGDHLIARANLKTVTDLKGKTIALQQGGPHVGMLDDVLKSAQLTWNDIQVVWTKDLTASPDSPAELFRKRNDIDACFAITPDMVGLCGGLHDTGSGAEGTVKGARVLVSTAELSRSIADVYVCRKDFFDANKELVTKFVAAYLKACEEIIDLRKAHESSPSQAYRNLLQMTQDIYGKTTIPVLEDADGLLADCTFVGYPGNVAFFTASKTLLDLVRAGMQKGVLKRTGTTGNYQYFLSGQPLDLQATAALTRLIETGSFDGVPDNNPRETLQSALNLSRARAEEVRDAIIRYAGNKGLVLDSTQIQPAGVGIREPIVPRPTNMDEAARNMRVEFRLVRVQAEAARASDFDF